MIAETPRCCDKCRGRAPHMFCRHKPCDCHKKQLAAPGYSLNLYRDPTARKAIARAQRNIK